MQQQNDSKVIHGYKSFNSDYTNINGLKFDVDKVYHIDGDIKFGPKGNGYHFALNLEDTIRYSGYDCGTVLRDVVIAEVIGSGIIVEGFDDYNEYYDMYAASDIKVIKYLSRKEVINYALNLRGFRLLRFVSLYRLNADELPLFYGIENMVDRELDRLYIENDKGYTYKLKGNK